MNAGALWHLGTESPKDTFWSSEPDKSTTTFGRSSTVGTEAENMKLWFCTTCNNQSRIDEELGSSILSSPFAQVVSHSSVQTVALISPLKALSRKWCTFEFSLAQHAGKDTLLVTKDGVVQAGQVPPIFLKELSESLVHFDSEKASVSTVKDGIMIDEAVADMGGFNVINEHVILIFGKAIDEAHMCTEYARNLLVSHPLMKDGSHTRNLIDEASVSRQPSCKCGAKTESEPALTIPPITMQQSIARQISREEQSIAREDPEREGKEIIVSL